MQLLNIRRLIFHLNNANRRVSFEISSLLVLLAETFVSIVNRFLFECQRPFLFMNLEESTPKKND